MLLQLFSAGLPLSEEQEQEVRAAGLIKDEKPEDENVLLDGRQHLWLTDVQAKEAREREENPQPKAECYLDRIPQEWKDREITKDDWCPKDIQKHARDPEFRKFISSHIPRFDKIKPNKQFWLFIEQALRWLAEGTTVSDFEGEDQRQYVLEEFHRGHENRMYWALKYGYIKDDGFVGGFRKYDASTPQALLFWLRACKFSGELGKSRQAAITSTIMLDCAITILATPSYSGVLVTDDVEFTGKKIFSQKMQSSIRAMLQKNPWMKPRKWNWSAKNLTAFWGGSSSKEDAGAFSAEYTVAAANETQAINGTQVSEVDIDECQNVWTYQDIKLEARPAMISVINGVARVTRMLWAYGTGNRKQTGGGAFEAEYKGSLVKWRKGDDTSTTVPLFFDRTCRPGWTDKNYLDEYDFYMRREDEGMKGMTKEERMAVFFSAYPNKPEDMFLTSHKHIVPALTITDAWELIERHCANRGIPVLGHYEPIMNPSIPMPEGTWYPFKVVDAKWVTHPPDDLNAPCRRFFDRPRDEPWAYRWTHGTDPAVIGSGSSMFASAIWDSVGAYTEVNGIKVFNPTIACILNDSKPNMEDCFNQAVLMGMYYRNHGQQACPELVEANRGGEYTRWKTGPQFNLSQSLIYRTQLPPKYQGGGHLHGIDMKNNAQNSRKTELFFDIVAFIRAYGPRKDDRGRVKLNIWDYQYWTQLYNIEVEEKVTGAIQFATRNKNAYNDDLVYAVQYAFIASQCVNNIPVRIDAVHPEFKMTEVQYLDMNTLEPYTVLKREPILYV